MQYFTHARIVSLSALLCAASCAGGSSDEAQTSQLTFAITDAPSDELQSFQVEIEQLTITDLDGTTFDVLPAPVMVELTELTDLSQVFAHGVVGDGRYLEAELTLDFSNARCVLVGENVPAALEDENGAPLSGTLTLPVQFAGVGLTLLGGRHRVIEFDFDLDQSLAIDAANNVVTVEPVVVMRVDRAQQKDVIAFGELLGVSSADSTFELALQTLGGTPLGELRFDALPTTVYQLDGVPSVGTPGRDLLALMPAGTWVQVYATMGALDRNFEALYVEAGAGTFNGGQGIVEGFVVDRSGAAGADAVLTVLGRSQNAAHTVFTFDTLFTVQTSFADTKVLRRGLETPFDTDDVNVGQMVRAFGSLSGTTLDATATTGVVRIQPTRVFGFANAAPAAGVLEIDLQRVGLRDVLDFDFGSGGTTPPDAAQFTLDIGLLGAGLDIDVGTAVEAIGTFAAVDDAGEDFVADVLIDRDTAPSLMLVRDRFGGLLVNVTANAGSLVFDLTGTPLATELAVVDQGLAGQIALPTGTDTIVSPAGAGVLCVLFDKDVGTVRVFTQFDDFSDGLGDALSSAGRLANFGALGDYDAALDELVAALIVAIVD